MLLKFSDYLRPIHAIKKAYRGVVVYNQDPEQIGRIQVNIPDFIEGTAQSDGTWNLPWIYQKTPAMLGGNGLSSGFAVPEVGSEVFVEFPYDDIYSGFYSYFWQSEVTHQSFLSEDYPNSYGFSDATGTQFKIDKTKLFLEFLHASGAYFFIDEQSNITVQTNSQIIFTSSDYQNQIVFDLTTGAITTAANASQNATAQEVNNTIGTLNENIGTHNDTVSGTRITNISGGMSSSVGGDIAVSALGNYCYTAAGNKSTLVAGTTSETFGGNKTESVVLGNWEVSLEAGNLQLTTLLGSATIGNELASLTISTTGDIKLSNAVGGSLHINPAGQVALGNHIAEVLSLLGQVLTTLTANAAAFVFTGVGPGALNPTIITSLTEISALLTSITGTV